MPNRGSGSGNVGGDVSHWWSSLCLYREWDSEITAWDCSWGRGQRWGRGEGPLHESQSRVGGPQEGKAESGEGAPSGRWR